MPTLDIIVVNTYNTDTLAIADASFYDIPIVSPTIEITPPGFCKQSFNFNTSSLNVYNANTLGIGEVGDALPDGVWFFKYSINPAYENYVEKSIMRVDRLQEKFDSAFLKLDFTECDKAIKTQSKVELNTAYFFIQGAIAAANNCAIDEANKLYLQADKMLDNFIKNNCGCSGNNYIVNFPLIN